jgi:hypothetical protein
MQNAGPHGMHYETSRRFHNENPREITPFRWHTGCSLTDENRLQGEHQMKVNPNHVLRHNYAIWVMGRRPGWFKPQRYMYRCLRCKWAFMVNDDHSGSLRVAGDEHVSSEETRRRLASFAEGPCPGYDTTSAAAEPVYPGNVIAMRRENRPAKTVRNARAI